MPPGSNLLISMEFFRMDYERPEASRQNESQNETRSEREAAWRPFAGKNLPGAVSSALLG
jgi:hypothetical protein